MVPYQSIPQDDRVLQEALYLVSKGIRIQIICLGYPNQKEKEIINGIEVYRIYRISEFKDREKLINLIIFCCKSFLTLIKTSRKIIQAHDPTGLPSNFLYRILFNKRILFYDSNELFPENALSVKGYISYFIVKGIETINSTKIDILISFSKLGSEFISNRLNIIKSYSGSNFPSRDQTLLLLSKNKNQ